MNSFLELLPIWTLHPFYVLFTIADHQKKRAAANEAQSADPIEGDPVVAKPESWFAWVLGTMIFSAIGTGLWVLLHWGVLWLVDKPFHFHDFIQGRGTAIDFMPYVLSVVVMLSFAWRNAEAKDGRLQQMLQLVRTLCFVVSFYILMINYLYWWKH